MRQKKKRLNKLSGDSSQIKTAANQSDLEQEFNIYPIKSNSKTEFVSWVFIQFRNTLSSLISKRDLVENA